MDYKNTEAVDFSSLLSKLITDKILDIHKWRRFKVGCKVTDCELQELLLLSKILCQTPCYLTEEDYSKLENRLTQLKNG